MGAFLSAEDKTNTVASTSLKTLLPVSCTLTSQWSSRQITGRDSVRLSALTLLTMIERFRFFLTNNAKTIYQLLSNLASSGDTPNINVLAMTEIETYIKHQFDPKQFVARKRFKFWSEMQRKPGKSVLKLAARILQASATCDFRAIKDPSNEALRTCFMQSWKHCLTLYVPGYFYTLFVPGGGANLPPYLKTDW